MGISANSIILSDTDRECNSRDSGRPESRTASHEKEKISDLDKARTEIYLLRGQLETERNMKNQIAEVLTFETGLRRYTNKGWFQILSQQKLKIRIHVRKFYDSFFGIFMKLNLKPTKTMPKIFISTINFFEILDQKIMTRTISNISLRFISNGLDFTTDLRRLKCLNGDSTTSTRYRICYDL